jgi:Uma2 family endonuclease
MSVAIEVGHAGPWTIADVLALPEDRRFRYELIGDALLMSPAPGMRHQRTSYRLHVALERAAQAAGAAVQILEAVNVTLPSGLTVPDLVVADAAAPDAVGLDAEAVQLVVELTSPGNAPMDRRFKPLLYAEAGIPAFWRVEFEPAPRLVAYELHGGRYEEVVTVMAGATQVLAAPFPVEIDPAGLMRG